MNLENNSRPGDQWDLSGDNEGTMGEVMPPRPIAWRDGSMRNGWQSNEDEL